MRQPDDPGVDRADFDFDDMSMGTARVVVVIIGAAGLVFFGIVIGALTWWFR